MTSKNENDPMAQISGSIRVPHEVLKANAYLQSYVERMQEEADGYRHGDRRWEVISSFAPRLWPPSRPQPDESKLMEDDLDLIAMARGRYEELSDDEKKLDLSQMWASEGDLRPAGMALEAAGRGADDRLVHAATGEMMVPRALLTNDTWLRFHLVRVFEEAGLDWRTCVVGGPNRINPATGLAEFDPGRDGLDEANVGDGYQSDAFDARSDFGGGGENGRTEDFPDLYGGQSALPGTSDPFDVDTSTPALTGGISGATSIGGQTQQPRNYLTRVASLASSEPPRNALITNLLRGGDDSVGRGLHGPAGSNEVLAYYDGLSMPSVGTNASVGFTGIPGSKTRETSNSIPNSIPQIGGGIPVPEEGLTRKSSSTSSYQDWQLATPHDLDLDISYLLADIDGSELVSKKSAARAPTT